jgi:hypothetical protein
MGPRRAAEDRAKDEGDGRNGKRSSDHKTTFESFEPSITLYLYVSEKLAGKKEAGLLENDGGREYETCSKAEGTASTHQRRVHEARRGGRVLQEISN